MVNYELLRQVRKLLAPCASKYEVKAEHWIHGWDEGLSFCFECAEKKVTELLAEQSDEDYCVDGGWGSEGDSQAFCETCTAPLDNSFTVYAANQELDHFEEHGLDPNDPCDCYCFLEVIAAEGCCDSELNERIERFAAKVLAQIQPTASASALSQ